jgi:hypothetical protein
MGLTTMAALLTGCASHDRLATPDERATMQTTIQQYATASRLTGAVHLNEKVRIKDNGQANVGYVLYEPRVQLTPQRMHAKMVKTEEGWHILDNTADLTIHDRAVWPMVPPPNSDDVLRQYSR